MILHFSRSKSDQEITIQHKSLTMGRQIHMYIRVYMCLCSVSAYIVRDGEIEETTLIFERECIDSVNETSRAR